MSGRLRRRALISVITGVAAVLAMAHPASADPSDEAYFVQAINNVRASRGLPALAVDGQLTAVARSWSAHMDADGAISHNPSLGSQVGGWRTLGENVGTGLSLDSIESAFENSPHHLENMVDPNFRTIGVGVVHDSDGTYWVTEDFKQPSGSAAPAPAPRPPAPAAPRPAPRPAPRAVAPKPVPHPAAAAPVHAAAAAPPPAPVPTTAATVAPATTVPLAVLATNARRSPAPGSDGVSDPLNVARRMALVAVVLMGAAMALVARVRTTVPA